MSEREWALLFLGVFIGTFATVTIRTVIGI